SRLLMCNHVIHHLHFCSLISYFFDVVLVSAVIVIPALFPYTTLFRSLPRVVRGLLGVGVLRGRGIDVLRGLLSERVLRLRGLLTVRVLTLNRLLTGRLLLHRLLTVRVLTLHRLLAEGFLALGGLLRVRVLTLPGLLAVRIARLLPIRVLRLNRLLPGRLLLHRLLADRGLTLTVRVRTRDGL